MAFLATVSQTETNNRERHTYPGRIIMIPMYREDRNSDIDILVLIVGMVERSSLL